jgi:hypothetical protein
LREGGDAVTPDDLRRIALSLPQVAESSHMGHPDFRVAGKVFATLGWPDGAWAMVKLTADQQAMLVATMPKIFQPVSGGWGRRGSTDVRLAAADELAIENALATAWRNVAPKALVKSCAGAQTREEASAAKQGKTAGIGRGHLDRALTRVRAAAHAAKLPEIEEGTSYGTPGMKVRGKVLMRVKDADTLVFRCAIDEKEMLMESAPEVYFETDHYKGWPVVLVRLSKASDAELKTCLERAWRLQAPAKLLGQFEGKRGVSPKRSISSKRSG